MQQFFHLRTSDFIWCLPHKWISFLPFSLQYFRVTPIRILLKGQQRIVLLSLRRLSQVETGGRWRIHSDIAEAVEGPSKCIGVEGFEPLSFEGEGHERYLGGIGAGDFTEAAYGEQEILKAVGGVVFRDSACPNC